MYSESRLATAEDAAQIGAIYASSVLYTPASFEEEPPTEEQMRQRITQTLERLPWFVLEKAGTVTGYSMSIFTGGDAATDALVAARLEQLFGKGKDDRGMYIDYPGPPKAKAELRKDSGSFGHTVWVADHKK